MAAIASQSVALRASAPAPARAGARRAGKAVRLPSSRVPGSVALPRRRGDAAVTSAAAELAQVALDEETITIIIAAVIGLGAGLGCPSSSSCRCARLGLSPTALSRDRRDVIDRALPVPDPATVAPEPP